MKQQSHSQSFTSQKGIYKIFESEIENIDNIHVQEESVRVRVTLIPAAQAGWRRALRWLAQACRNVATLLWSAESGGARRDNLVTSRL